MNDIYMYPPFCHNPLCKLFEIMEFQNDYVYIQENEGFSCIPKINSKVRNQSIRSIYVRRHRYENKFKTVSYFCDTCNKAIAM